MDDNCALMPNNIAAEQALIGSLVMDNENISYVVEFLRQEYFFDPLHGRIYKKIIDLWGKGLLASAITLKDFINKDSAFCDHEDKNAGYKFIVDLISNTPFVMNVRYFAEIIRDLFIARSLIGVGKNLVGKVTENADDSVYHTIENTEHSLYLLANEYRQQSAAGAGRIGKTIKEVKERVASGADITGLPTGFCDIDTLLGGFYASDLIIIAARPSMGKTSLAVNMAVNMARRFLRENKDDSVTGREDERNEQIKSVAYFSLEMSSDQLGLRILSMDSGINASKLRLGMLSQKDISSIEDHTATLVDLPLIADDTPAITVASLRSRIRRMRRKDNLQCVFIDYLQLMRAGSKGMSDVNRVQEVSEITQGLKSIAKEFNIPIIALSQISRAVEQRDDKRPQLSDLRESGSIEQDADIVMFIYRDEYYELRKQPQEGTAKHMEWQKKMDKIMNQADIIVAKHRNGPIGIRKLYFDSNTTTFKNHFAPERAEV